MMAAQARLPDVQRDTSSLWIRKFLVQELSPYPGRGWTVARMTIAATLMMVCIMVFHLPGAALGAYYTLLFSRESTYATVRGVAVTLTAVSSSILFVLVGAILLLGNPFLHFVWVATTLFVIFFLLSAMNEYPAATAFGFLAVTAIPIWDFPANPRLQVEGTLWTGLSIVVGALITVAVEMLGQGVFPFEQISEGLDIRLKIVEEALSSWAQGRELNEATGEKLAQFTMTGIGTLRQALARSSRNPQDLAAIGALAALVGRLIDLCTAREESREALSSEDRHCCQKAADQVSSLRPALRKHDLQAVAQIDSPVSHSTANSLIEDIEDTLAQIPQVLSGLRPLAADLRSAVDLQEKHPVFKVDALSNPDHLKFALKGTLASGACYVIYNGLAWPGLSTSVATCMITALSSVGSSRQKQLLRVGGAFLGSVVIGMSVQVFLLPYMDGITEFTVLFAAVTALSSWIGTSSPRLAYAGLQTAFAFYVTHLRTFGPQTSLTVARDDVLGIMLGLGAMWVSFDQIWAKDASVEVLDLFVGNLRRIARFDSTIMECDLATVISRSRTERAAVTSSFDAIRNGADALIFEFGAHWRQKVALRNQVRAWQPQLRTYLLLELALVHYRLQSAERRLEPEEEENVKKSRSLLELLADFKDRRKQQEAETTRSAIRQALESADKRHERGNRNQKSGTRNQLSITRSMLKASYDLAQAIVEAG